jgi:hypothetical protein
VYRISYFPCSDRYWQAQARWICVPSMLDATALEVVGLVSRTPMTPPPPEITTP